MRLVAVRTGQNEVRAGDPLLLCVRGLGPDLLAASPGHHGPALFLSTGAVVAAPLDSLAAILIVGTRIPAIRHVR